MYRSPNIISVIRRLRWPGNIARMIEGSNSLRILTGKPKGKIPLGRPRRR